LLTAAPFFIVYFIRLAMNPSWIYCKGCEIEVFDAGYIIGIATFALILSILANPTFSKKTSRRDGLRIVRECMWSWQISGFFFNLSFILYLTDPGQLYALGIFNWRMVMLFAIGMLFHVQSIHQVLLSSRIKRELVLATALDQNERFTEVMSNKELRAQLVTFLDSELSPEVIQFLTDVDDYKNSFDKDGAQFKGRQIFSTYIQSGAPLEINISSQLREDLLRRMPRGQFEQGIFDNAYMEVKKNFLGDGFSRFIKKLESSSSSANKPSNKSVVSHIINPGGAAVQDDTSSSTT
jgi:Regulator of G protein signaling domain